VVPACLPACLPAAAVIAAPIAYITVVAVKKLVVGSRVSGVHGAHCMFLTHKLAAPCCSSLSVSGGRNVYFEQITLFKACIMLHGIME